jgi:hypothetical protein
MKYLLRIVLLLVALFACVAISLAQKNRTPDAATPAPTPAPALSERESSAANWMEFSSAPGRFSILFPDKPKESTEPMGEVDAHILSLQTFAEYSVMYADYPEPIENAAAAHNILDSGVQSAVASVNSELLETKDISLDGNPGKYLKERLPDGKVLRAKMLLVGQRIYQIAITTPEEKDKPVESSRFYDSVASKYLDSFKLITGQK